eukprot:scaffold4286_cov92-Amphora_coffeaeformis.AAC.9
MASSGSVTSASLEERCVPPKRCRTAYNIFYQAERNRIVASIPSPSEPSKRPSRGGRPVPHGKIGFLDLARKISVAWKNLSDEERSKYVEIARVDKTRYLEEKAAWKNSVAELERIHSSTESLPSKKMLKTKISSSKGQMNGSFPSVPGIRHPRVVSPSLRSFPNTQDALEPTPICSMVLADPYTPLPYSSATIATFANDNAKMNFRNHSYSALEVQSLQHVSRQLDTASLSFIIDRLS